MSQEIRTERSMSSQTGVSVKVLVIYAESDRKTYKDVLKPAVDNHGIKCCTLEDDGEASNTKTNNFTYLLGKCVKVLFVLSDAFKQDGNVSRFAEMASGGNTSPENIVSVVLGGSVWFEDAILCLGQLERVMLESDGWQRKLLSALHYTLPKFCHNIGSPLETRGLTFRNMQSDIHGIAVEIDNTRLRIDVEEFLLFLSTHEKFNTCKSFGECVPLYTEKTAVSLYYRDDLNKMQNLLNLLTYICGDLFNISAARKQKHNDNFRN